MEKLEKKQLNELATINGIKQSIKRVECEKIGSSLPEGSEILLPADEIFCAVTTENGTGYPILGLVLKVGKIQPKSTRYCLLWRSQFAPVNDDGEPLSDFSKEFGETPIERNQNLRGKVLQIKTAAKYQLADEERKRTMYSFSAHNPTAEQKKLLTLFDSVKPE